MAFCLHNGDDGKDFSFMFKGSSCQGDFFRGAEELHDLNHNFAVSNVVVELFWWSEWFFYYGSLFWGLRRNLYIGFSALTFPENY